MSDAIRVTAIQREPIDAEGLGLALLEVVEQLDAKTCRRLAKVGEAKLEAAHVAQKSGGEQAA